MNVGVALNMLTKDGRSDAEVFAERWRGVSGCSAASFSKRVKPRRNSGSASLNLLNW